MHAVQELHPPYHVPLLRSTSRLPDNWRLRGTHLADSRSCQSSLLSLITQAARYQSVPECDGVDELIAALEFQELRVLCKEAGRRRRG
jgi:hypothetical protein